jgi:cell division protein FtsB
MSKRSRPKKISFFIALPLIAIAAGFFIAAEFTDINALGYAGGSVFAAAFLVLFGFDVYGFVKHKRRLRLFLSVLASSLAIVCLFAQIVLINKSGELSDRYDALSEQRREYEYGTEEYEALDNQIETLLNERASLRTQNFAFRTGFMAACLVMSIIRLGL